jgi:protein-S-isoprenylcysteine O-methyltransferase Ste14
MTPVQIAKVVLALAGLVVFLLGVQSGQDLLRWIGISLVVVAWLLRFIKPKTSSENR